MNELQSVTDIDEVIKYAERESEGCHQMASAYHTDEGVYLHEETRFQYKAILWENIHEWLEELKELRKKQRKHGEWISKNEKRYCSNCKKMAIYVPSVYGPSAWLTDFCPNCGADNRPKEGKPDREGDGGGE